MSTLLRFFFTLVQHFVSFLLIASTWFLPNIFLPKRFKPEAFNRRRMYSFYPLFQTQMKHFATFGAGRDFLAHTVRVSKTKLTAGLYRIH